MKNISITNLPIQYRRIQTEIDEAVLEVLASGNYINGPAVELFAQDLAEYTGAKHVIPCGNGTDALIIALMALGLEEKDEVIVPAFTYAAAIEAIALRGLVPVLVDVNPWSFNIDVTKIEAAISPKTKAIVPVHLFGQSCDMEPLLKIAKKHKLFVIEDNAQSIGAVYTFSDGTSKQTGTMGDVGTLSFFPTKNLGSYGDGGAILTNNDELALKLRMVANHGQSQKYHHEILGFNSRLDTIQAAVLRVKLKYLDKFVAERKKLANTYREGLGLIDNCMETPYCIPCSTHVYHQFTVKVMCVNRDSLRKHLASVGIPTMVYYPTPIHHQPAFKDIVRISGELTASEDLCDVVLSLPMHSGLDQSQVLYIMSEIADYE